MIINVLGVFKLSLFLVFEELKELDDYFESDVLKQRDLLVEKYKKMVEERKENGDYLHEVKEEEEEDGWW